MPGIIEKKRQERVKKYFESEEGKRRISAEVLEAVKKYLSETEAGTSHESDEYVDEEDENTNPNVKLKPIRKVSEKLNDDTDRWASFTVYVDTRQIKPGAVVYVIEKVEPNEKTPYVTYKPAERIVTEVQDNGVNNGTVFLTYSPKIASVSTYYTPQHNAPQVISEHDVIYSPLTKAHAEFVCKLLNVQSKALYKKYVRQIEKQKNNGR